MHKIWLLSTVAAGLLPLSALADSAGEMPKLNLELNGTTVSGVSSGGYMATQFHLAHAEWVDGIGVVAAGPMYCAQNGLLSALASCVNKQEPPAPLEALNAYVSDMQSQGKLAPASALKGDKAWLLRGNLDTKIAPGIADDLAKQYTAWLGESHVTYSTDKPFAHHFPTVASGSACGVSEAPYLGNCDYDAAGEILTYLIDDVRDPSDTTTGVLHKVAQPVDDFSGASLGEHAYVYVPTACAEGESCGLHISFHGCNQFSGAQGVTNDYAKDSGFNRWADNNNLVVLYPQTTSSMAFPLNPQGCWDWWGYTGEDYATKQGKQIQAVKVVIDGMMKERGE